MKGLESNPKVRSAVDCGEMPHGDVREEIAVGNTFGEKLGGHGGKVTQLSHMLEVAPSMQTLTTRWHGQLINSETPERVAL